MLAKISLLISNFFNRDIHKSTKPRCTIMEDNVNYSINSKLPNRII